MDWINIYEKVIRLYPTLIIEAIEYIQNNSEKDKIFVSKMIDAECLMWRWRDINIISDHPTRHNIDSVFPPHPESLFLAKLIPNVYGNKKFLDVGVGSGILAIVAAKRGWESTGIDINERVLKVTNINSMLNNVSIMVELSNLGKSQKGKNIQLCIANLPFESTPEECINYIHADGGLYGDKLILPFFEILPDLLVDEGLALIPSFSLTKNGKSRLELHLSNNVSRNLVSILIRLSKPIEVRSLYSRYSGNDWKKSYNRLKNEGYTHFFVELAILRKVPVGEGTFLGVLDLLLADKTWIMPVGWGGIGQPRS